MDWLPGQSSERSGERSLVPEVGVDHGEKQRHVALAAGRMGGGGSIISLDLGDRSPNPFGKIF